LRANASNLHFHSSLCRGPEKGKQKNMESTIMNITIETNSEVYSDADLRTWIDQLSSEDGSERQEARRILVNIGEKAEAPLIQTLSRGNRNARWGAAVALGEIGDPRTAEALVKALEDEDISVRWAAADALIKLDRACLEPLLLALTRHFDSVWLREGARYVLHSLKRLNLLNSEENKVLSALKDYAPAMGVPWVAETAYETLLQTKKNSVR
jgi:HEAT repeat protein